jgi:hypothetical protein
MIFQFSFLSQARDQFKKKKKKRKKEKKEKSSNLIRYTQVLPSRIFKDSLQQLSNLKYKTR